MIRLVNILLQDLENMIQLLKHTVLLLFRVKMAIMDILFQADTGMLPGTRQQGYYTQQYFCERTKFPTIWANFCELTRFYWNTEQFTTLSLL